MIAHSPTRRTVFISGLALAGCGGRSTRSLASADTHPSDYPTVRAVQFFAEAVEKRSNGRIRVKVFSGGQLGEERDTLEITIFGGLDFNRVNLAPLNSIVPETVVPNLPFIFRSVEHMRAAMDGAPGQRILSSLERHGLIGLCFYDSGARSFYTRNRAINSPDDLRGQKIRVQNSDLFVSMIEALGGDATPMSFGEVYQGLLQGVVDGAENNWPSYESTRHFEAAPNYSLTRHVMAPEIFLVSARRWEKLSPEDRRIIRSAARDSVPIMRELWDQRVSSSKRKLMDAGIDIHEPDSGPFRDAVQPVWNKYLNTPQLERIAAEISDFEVP